MQTTEQDRETDALDAFRLEDYLSLPDPFAAFLVADLADGGHKTEQAPTE